MTLADARDQPPSSLAYRPGRAFLGRLLLVGVTLIGISFVTFALVHLAPGDAASLRAGSGRGVTSEIIKQNRELAGLDQPFGRRYLQWLGHSLTLDFGHSLRDGRQVRTRLAEALPQTLSLGLLAALMAIGIAVPLGSWSALRAERRRARAVEVVLAILYAMPSVATALLLLHAGAGYADEGPALAAAICLAYPSAIVLSRHQRGALLGVLRAEFMRTARAKGLSEISILRHALRNSLLPLVTLLGAQVPALLSGSVIVEQIFGIRGLGQLGYQAVLDRDLPMLMGLLTLSAALVLVGVLLADAACLVLDPRLRQREPGDA